VNWEKRMLKGIKIERRGGRGNHNLSFAKKRDQISPEKDLSSIERKEKDPEKKAPSREGKENRLPI